MPGRPRSRGGAGSRHRRGPARSSRVAEPVTSRSGARAARTATARSPGARPGTSEAGIQTVSTAIGSPLPSRRRVKRTTGSPSRTAAGREGGVGGSRLERQQPAAGHEATLTHVLREGRQAEESGERPRRDVRAGAVAPLDEPLGDERVGCAPDGHARDTPAAATVAFAGQAVADSRRRDEFAQPRADVCRVESSRSTAAVYGAGDRLQPCRPLSYAGGPPTSVRALRRFGRPLDRPGRIPLSGRGTVAAHALDPPRAMHDLPGAYRVCLLTGDSGGDATACTATRTCSAMSTWGRTSSGSRLRTGRRRRCGVRGLSAGRRGHARVRALGGGALVAAAA